MDRVGAAALSLGVLLASPASAWAEERAEAAGDTSTERVDSVERTASAPTRSVWIAPTYQLLLTESFDPSSRSGLGASVSYEFHISPRFNLGLGLAYRLYPGERSTHQLGYGAILKHFFSDHWSQLDGFYPFVDYGLLLQQTFVAGRGAAVSHDTRLGAGAVLRVSGIPWFIGAAWHYSRLDFFDVESEWIPYIDAQIGWIYSF